MCNLMLLTDVAHRHMQLISNKLNSNSFNSGFTSGYNIHFYFAPLSHGMKTLLNSQIVLAPFLFSTKIEFATWTQTASAIIMLALDW